MSYNPEILVAPQHLDEIKLLTEAGATAFVLGDERFALVGRGHFSPRDLEKAVTLIHELGKKAYLLIDAIFPNQLLEALALFLGDVAHVPFDGVRVADLGALMLIKDRLPTVPIHFVDAMMLTNSYTVNYWAKRGVERIKLAHELTRDEVLAIKKDVACDVELLIQGAPLMFTSRRRLIDNYLDFQRRVGKDATLQNTDNYLFDAERDLYYPVVENDHGTHIYGGNDVCMVDDLIDIAHAGIDVLYIEGYTYDQTEDLVAVINLYKMAIALINTDSEKYQKAGTALYAEVVKHQGAKRKTDRGFYYKPTIYKNQSDKK